SVKQGPMMFQWLAAKARRWRMKTLKPFGKAASGLLLSLGDRDPAGAGALADAFADAAEEGLGQRTTAPPGSGTRGVGRPGSHRGLSCSAGAFVEPPRLSTGGRQRADGSWGKAQGGQQTKFQRVNAVVKLTFMTEAEWSSCSRVLPMVLEL